MANLAVQSQSKHKSSTIDRKNKKQLNATAQHFHKANSQQPNLEAQSQARGSNE